jgi:hypothetical protein
MRVLFVMALTLAATPAQAERMKYLTSDAQGADLYIDIDSVRRMPPIPNKRPFPAVQVLTVYDYSKVRREPAREARALLTFNCQQRTMAILSYVKRRPDGRPIQDWRSIDYDFKYQPAEADTMTAYVMADVCGWAPPAPMVQPFPQPAPVPPPVIRPMPFPPSTSIPPRIPPPLPSPIPRP